MRLGQRIRIELMFTKEIFGIYLLVFFSEVFLLLVFILCVRYDFLYPPVCARRDLPSSGNIKSYLTFRKQNETNTFPTV